MSHPLRQSVELGIAQKRALLVFRQVASLPRFLRKESANGRRDGVRDVLNRSVDVIPFQFGGIIARLNRHVIVDCRGGLLRYFERFNQNAKSDGSLGETASSF